MITRSDDTPFGATCLPEGIRFALWAPSAKRVDVVLAGGSALPMHPADGGWFEALLPGHGDGTRYQYRIDDDLLIPDPASRFQPDGIFAASQVVDASTYQWRSSQWRGRPWHEAVVWEAHVGTATREGTYAALQQRLAQLKDLGVTAIELMPLADCPGQRNWGYDGVLPFAPNSAYGTPDDLRRFIDAAHEHGIMVLIDVVYNHFGPSGNYLHAYAKSFFTERHQTPWGAGLNFDDANASAVRRFFVDNAWYWLNEFRADGLRLDAVHAIRDDSERHVLTEIAESIRQRSGDRQVHLVLENEENEAKWLERDQAGSPRLYTAQWNDDAHHCWHVILTGETEGYYRDFADHPVEQLDRSLTGGFVFQGHPSKNRAGGQRGEPSAHLPPEAFVDFLQNHDQIGNRAFGDRIASLSDPGRLSTATAVMLLSPHVPMLFMGEEWGAKTPFLFFVDFSDDEALSKAVREGRQKEFSSFSAFSGKADGPVVPDPTAQKTFVDSKLDWAEIDQPEHARFRQNVREVLAIRRRHVVPLLASGWIGAESNSSGDLVDVTWRFKGGSLRLLLNFGKDPAGVTTRPDDTLVWSTSGASRPDDTLPPWGAQFLRGRE